MRPRLRTHTLEVSRRDDGKAAVNLFLGQKKPFFLRRSMQSNSSASGPLGALNVCGGEEDDISRVVSLTGAASNLAALNLSLNCWLLILSKESSLDLHADGANLAVG